MKTWTKICSNFLFILTFIIFISGMLILFLKVSTGSKESPMNGIYYIKHYDGGFWQVLQLTGKNHKYLDEMFNPKFCEGSLYFASGLNLLVVVVPLMLFFSIFISKLMWKKTLYPISEIFINELKKIKKDKKRIKNEFKNKIKIAKNKEEKFHQKNLLKQKLLFIQKNKLETKNKINIDYKLKYKYSSKIKKAKNEV